MNNDTTALQERIARALDPDARDLTMDRPYIWEAAMADAAAVLPIIAAEMQAAKAAAWDECAEMAAHHGAFDGGRARWLSSINPHREEGAGHDD